MVLALFPVTSLRRTMCKKIAREFTQHQMEDAMENGGLVSIQNAIDANRGIWNLSIFVFFGGIVLLSLHKNEKQDSSAFD